MYEQLRGHDIPQALVLMSQWTEPQESARWMRPIDVVNYLADIFYKWQLDLSGPWLIALGDPVVPEVEDNPCKVYAEVFSMQCNVSFADWGTASPLAIAFSTKILHRASPTLFEV